MAADALAYELAPQSFTAGLVITGAFAYFEPVAPGSATSLAARLYQALEPEGLLCLEIYPHPDHRRLLAATGGKARIWTELPADDPWRFYLSDLSLDESGEILTHEKTFFHRLDGRVDAGRVERLYVYTQELCKSFSPRFRSAIYGSTKAGARSRTRAAKSWS